MFKLGAMVKDQITGFTGVITGRCEYITGCRQYLLVPKGTSSTVRAKAEWFDEDRLEQKGTKLVTVKKGNPGPDMQAPNKG